MLSFDVSDSPAFEIPLSNVSQCATGKNEVTLEFHQNDDAEVALMEVRFYVPPGTGEEGTDPVEVCVCVCLGLAITQKTRKQILKTQINPLVCA